MSEREKLFQIMAGGWSLTQAEAAPLYQAIDAFAHELAEQIRGWAAVQVGGEIEEIYGYAADLIDPEADDYVRPVRPDEEPTT